MTRPIVRENQAGLIDMRGVEIAHLAEHQVQPNIVIHISQQAHIVPPELGRRIMKQRVGHAGLIRGERAVAVTALRWSISERPTGLVSERRAHGLQLRRAITAGL
jgi:hypothetical protein